jgi:hypothetical protein
MRWVARFIPYSTRNETKKLDYGSFVCEVRTPHHDDMPSKEDLQPCAARRRLDGWGDVPHRMKSIERDIQSRKVWK